MQSVDDMDLRKSLMKDTKQFFKYGEELEDDITDQYSGAPTYDGRVRNTGPIHPIHIR